MELIFEQRDSCDITLYYFHSHSSFNYFMCTSHVDTEDELRPGRCSSLVQFVVTEKTILNKSNDENRLIKN
jgi:hypothetical protein